MDVFYRLFITLILILATGNVCASEIDDSNLSFSHLVFEKLSARLTALEKQSKIQQHRIAELESRDLARQKQDKIQRHRIANLESRDLAQQIIITDLEAAIRNQQQQTEELNRTLTETNQAFHNLKDVMAVQNYDTIEDALEKHNEDYSTGDNIIPSRRRRAVEVDNVAFSTVLVNKINDMGANQDVVFDKVETNIGNAYNSHHGVFTAPVSGTYVFHVTLLGLFSEESYCKIVVNGINKAQVYAHGDGSHHDQGSQMLVVRLNPGDDVAIQNIDKGHNVYGNGHLWTTFSGFLLRSDAEFNTIVG